MSAGPDLFGRALQYWIDERHYPGRRRERRDRGLTAEERWTKHLPELPESDYPSVAVRCRQAVDCAHAIALRHEYGELTQLEVYDAIAEEYPDLSRERVQQVGDYGWFLAIK